MMKRKVALLMTTVMLATSVFPSGITAYAEDNVLTGETTAEVTLDGTAEEPADVSSVDDDVDVSDEIAGTEADSAQAEEVVQAADDELQQDEFVAEEIGADETAQDAPAEEGEQPAPIVAEGDLIVSDVEVVDETVQAVSAAEAQDVEKPWTGRSITELSVGDNNIATITEGGSQWFSFTPNEDGLYVLFSAADDSFDPAADLYSSDQTEEELANAYSLADADDELGSCDDFCLEYPMKGNVTYYYRIMDCDDMTGSFKLGFYDVTPVGFKLQEGVSATAHIDGPDSIPVIVTYRDGTSETLKSGERGRHNNRLFYTLPEIEETDACFEKAGNCELEVCVKYTAFAEKVKIGNTFSVSVRSLEEAAGNNTLELGSENEFKYSIADEVIYTSFTPTESGDYVFQNNCYMGEMMIFKGDEKVLSPTQEENRQLNLEANTKYVIVLRLCGEENETTQGTLTVVEAKEIDSISFENAGVIDNLSVSSVLQGGFDFKLIVKYIGEDNSGEQYSYHDIRDYLETDSGAQIITSNGDIINISYDDNSQYLPGAIWCPLGTKKLKATVENTVKNITATKEFCITDDLADAEVLVPQKNYSARRFDNSSFYRCPEDGPYYFERVDELYFSAYKLEADIIMQAEVFSPSQGFDSSGVTYIQPYYEGTADTTTFMLKPVPTVEKVAVEQEPTKITYALDEDGYAYISTDGMKIRVFYTGNDSRVYDVEDDYEDQFGNSICTELYKLDSFGNPNIAGRAISWSVTSPGEYALVAGIGDEDDDGNFIYSRYAWTKIIVVSSDHKHIWEKRIDKNPTCTSVGKQSLYCRSCGSKQGGSTTDIPMTAHTWGQWTVTTAGKAVLTRTCTVCHTPQTQSFTPVLTLTANKLTMKTKQSTSKFKVTAMTAGDSLASVTSNNTKLLKVSNVNPNGTFKLKAQRKTGTAKLTITLKSGASKTIKVKIQKAKVKTTKVKVASKKLALAKKQKYDLAPVISPVTSYDKLKCTTSNKKVATVSKKGLVTAKKKGKATITITSGKKKVKVKVTVK